MAFNNPFKSKPDQKPDDNLGKTYIDGNDPEHGSGSGHEKPDPGDHTPMQLIYRPPNIWFVKRFGNDFVVTVEPDGQYGEEYVVTVDDKHHPHEGFGFPNLDEALKFCWRY